MSDKPLHYFDARTAERNIARGLITREEYDAFVGAADDCADNAIDVATRFTYSKGAPEQEVVVTGAELRALADDHAAMHRARISTSEPTPQA